MLEDRIVRPLEGTITGPAGVERVQPKVMQVLVHLAGRAGQVVQRDELLEAVWQGAPMTDEVLNRCISELRRHLDDKPRTPKFLQTIPKVGYRLIGSVAPTPHSDDDRGADEAEGPAADEGYVSQRRGTPGAVPAIVAAFGSGVLVATLSGWLSGEATSVVATALGVGSLIVAGLLAWRARADGGGGQGPMPEPAEPPAATPTAADGGTNTSDKDRPVTTVAVLPFQSLTPQAEQRYLADGMAAELHSTLSKLHRVRVAARTSTIALVEAADDIREVARRLDVHYVLSGSLHCAGDRMRVIAELENVEEGVQIWSETYEREVRDVFAVQSDIAHAIASAFGGERLREEITSASHRPPSNLDAWSHVQRARSYILRYSLQALSDAVPLLRRAVELDPDYAAAHAALASVLAEGVLNAISEDPAADRQESVAAARRASQLDPTDPFVLKMCGTVSAYFGDPENALTALRRAVELAPFDYGARGYFGWPLVATGREADLEELHALLEKNLSAATNHPGVPYWLYHRSVAFSCAHRDEQAVEFAEKSIGANPNYAWAWLQYANALGHANQSTKAQRAAKRAAEVNRALTPALFASMVADMSLSEAFTRNRTGGLESAGIVSKR